MREVSQSPWRDTKKLPATTAPADNSLAAIMARRRAIADSDASVASLRGNQNKPHLQSSPVVDPELQAAMQRRKMGVEVVSPRQNRAKPPMPPLPSAPHLRPIESARQDENQFDDGCSTSSRSFDSRPNISQSVVEEDDSETEENSKEEEGINADSETEENSEEGEGNNEDEDINDEEEDEEESSSHVGAEDEEESSSHVGAEQPVISDEEGPYRADGYCTTDGEEEMILLDDQTADSSVYQKRDHDDSSSSDGGRSNGDDEEYPYTTTDDEQECEEAEFDNGELAESEGESEADSEGTDPYVEDRTVETYSEYEDGSTVFTKDTVGRNDSFFQDPNEYAETHSYPGTHSYAETRSVEDEEEEQDDGEEEQDDGEEEQDDEDDRFNLRHPSFMTGLTTLTEERTLDLMSRSDIGEASAIDFENETVYEEETVQEQSVYDEKSVDQSYLEQESYLVDGQRENEYDDTDGGESHSESGDGFESDTDDEESFSTDYAGEDDECDEYENDPMMEIETLNSSVISSDLISDMGDWSQDTPGSLLERHFQSSHNKNDEYDYMFEDGEKSILGGLSVLDVVKEEESQEISADISADDSKLHLYSGVQKRPTPLERTTSTQSYILDSTIYEEGEYSEDEGGSKDERSEEEDSADDLESGRPEKMPLNDNDVTKQRCACGWPFLAIIVLLGSLSVGLGVGLFVLGFSADDPLPSAPTTAPSITITENDPSNQPDLPSDALYLYNLICPELWPGRSCDKTLLDMRIPSGLAFDWLSSNKLANPTIDIPERRILQRFALAAFFFSTNGYRWTVNSNWLSENHECEWYTSSFRGHGCDDSREIFIGLELDFNNVQGEITEEISLLKDLEVISLQNPEGPAVEGLLPSSLGALSRLTSLQIVGNRFSGGIPDEIGRMTALRSLVLKNNGLNGVIPSSIATLSSLRLMNLENNHFSGDIENEIFSSLVDLETLNLSGNKFSRLPDSLSSLKKLTKLNVGDNEFRWFPMPIFSMIGLEWLDISKNNFREPIPPSISRLVNLKYLNLASSAFTGLIPVEIGNLVNITDTLDLSSNLLVGSIPSRLGRLTSLERLLLNGNRLEGSIPPELAFLKHVVHIRLDDNNLEGFVPAELCDLYEEIRPSSYADCDKFVFSECFLFCCSKELGCRCQLEKIEPLRCISNRD